MLACAGAACRDVGVDCGGGPGAAAAALDVPGVTWVGPLEPGDTRATAWDDVLNAMQSAVESSNVSSLLRRFAIDVEHDTGRVLLEAVLPPRVDLNPGVADHKTGITAVKWWFCPTRLARQSQHVYRA